ncbi:ABC transporter ATP-binding protein [Carnimonas bestiolae]|uniref:ABC transporter ATP-binding protein n=1 Tax=Carnimonas bestiolae TaxID=3402172 RepID=UPI003EDC01CA
MQYSATALNVRYGRHMALDNFSLAIAPGSIHALIGPNGSGKSTALHAMAGLVTPSQGRVELDGEVVASMPRKVLAKKLAFLPQQPLAPDEMTVEQLVRQGRFAHVGLLGRYRAEDIHAITHALACTGLTSLAERTLRELSGGERQRAWIAAALAQEPSVLVLDEPTSFLDIGYQVEVLEVLHRLRSEKGVSVLMVLHDVNQAMSISDQLTLLCQGRTLFQGDAHGLAKSGLVERTFGVSGHFVDLDDNRARAPHFDITLPFG